MYTNCKLDLSMNFEDKVCQLQYIKRVQRKNDKPEQKAETTPLLTRSRFLRTLVSLQSAMRYEWHWYQQRNKFHQIRLYMISRFKVKWDANYTSTVTFLGLVFASQALGSWNGEREGEPPRSTQNQVMRQRPYIIYLLY